MRSVNCQVLDRVRSELARKVILDIDEGVWRQVDGKMGDQVQDSLFQIYYPLYTTFLSMLRLSSFFGHLFARGYGIECELRWLRR